MASYRFSGLVAIAVVVLATAASGNDSLKSTVGLYNSVAKTKQPGDNIALSPFSVDTALSMTLVGAAGPTKIELTTALGIPPDATAKSLGKKFQAVNGATPNYTLQSANALYLGKPHELKADYKNQVIQEFKATLNSVDFRSTASAEAARQQINAFVEEKTANKIKDLLPEGSLTSDSVLVLINAVYFKATWQREFDPAKTEADQEFKLVNGQTKNVSLMHAVNKFPYTVSTALGGAQVLELPYKGNETSMVVILPPKSGGGLRSVESALTATNLQAVLDDLRLEKVVVFLPKFKVSTDYDLIKPLKNMGVKKAFARGADFSAITPTQVEITEVKHKVFVEVDEKGTEAAGATAVNLGGRSMGPPRFRADRPFLFLIRHIPTNTTLFVGRISDPTVEK